MKKISCLICCRGGSKGILNKNIKEFCGKPLLEWTIKNALQSEIFDEIILSTDSNEIAEIGKSIGATVPGLRPDHLADDNSDVFDTHQYIFNKMNIEDSSHIVCILTNNPFIDAELLIKGYNAGMSKNHEIITLDTVEIGGDYLYYRQLYNDNGLLKFHFPNDMSNSNINRQTNAITYTTINNMRWGKPSYMSDYNTYKDNIINNGILPVNLPKIRNFDLDDTSDWIIAESVFKNLIIK